MDKSVFAFTEYMWEKLFWHVFIALRHFKYKIQNTSLCVCVQRIHGWKSGSRGEARHPFIALGPHELQLHSVALNFALCPLSTLNCALSLALFSLHYSLFTLHPVHFAFFILFFILSTLHCNICTVYSALDVALFTLHCNLFTVHFAL